MDLDDVADELYGVPLDEFVSTRTDRERGAKASGDKDLAVQIRKLAKPNQVAWLANQLARRHADEIRPLVELGADLRAATDNLTPDQLREFTRQQHRLVGALVAQAKQLAHEGGKKVSDETGRGLQETLQAALADPEAADRLLAGRLVEGMQHVGFGVGNTAPARHLRAVPSPVGGDGRSGRSARAQAGKAKEHRRQQELSQADREIGRAKEMAQDAVELRDDTRSALDEADGRMSDLEEQIEELRQQLDQAEAQRTKAFRDQRRVRTAYEHAEKAAQDAIRRLQRARAARDRIPDD